MSYPIPPEYERQQSRTVSKRSNTGDNYEEVTRHGQGYVCGSLSDRADTWHGPILPHSVGHSRERISAALETARVTASGFRDAIDISRLTDFLYPDLPRLVGADTIAYEEQQGANILGPVRAMARPVRTGDAPLGKIRRDAVADGYVRYSHELLSPTDDGRVFVGHAAIIPKRETVRARQEREQEEREAERKQLPERVPMPTAIAVLATGMLPGTSALWAHRGVTGSVSVSESKRYSATVSGQAVRSQRTVKGLQRQLETLNA
jgi:hypothetical protein